MSKDSLSKLPSSLPLENLLEQSGVRNNQNWLLTYLDVFVLLVMLVITLIALNDIKASGSEVRIKTKPISFKCPTLSEPASVSYPLMGLAANLMNSSDCTEFLSKILWGACMSSNRIGKPALWQSWSLFEKEKSDLGSEALVQETPLDSNPIQAEKDQNTVQTEVNRKLQKTLAEAIQHEGLAQNVKVSVNQNFAQLEIQDKVLFNSSDAELTPSGQEVIKHLVPLLRQLVGQILIEGHTDNMPIKTPQFPSNWELGASRALSVLHYLVNQQIGASRLRITSYADTMPLADNATPEGREKNRRVNIVILFAEQ